MERWRRRAALLAVVLLPGRTFGAARLELTATTTFAEPPLLRLVATNTGDEPARDALPRVLFHHRTVEGAAATVAAGATHEWRLALDVPPGPGTFPVTARLGYTDPGGGAGEVVVVTLLATPAAPAAEVHARIDARPTTGHLTASVVLENAGTSPVAGRVALVAPAGVHVEPESQPVRVAAAGQSTVPFPLTTRGVPIGATSRLTAVLEYVTEGAHYTALARVDVRASTSTGRALPLTIGLVALALTLALAGFAWRRAAAARPAAARRTPVDTARPVAPGPASDA